MSEFLVTGIDAVLTVLFFLPAKFIGYKKCRKCTVRLRYYQVLLLCTYHLRGVGAVRSRRVQWDLRVNPPRLGTPLVTRGETTYG